MELSNDDSLEKKIKDLQIKKVLPKIKQSEVLSLPVFIIVGHSTYSLDINKPLKVTTVPPESFLCHPSPPGSYCLYAANLREEDDTHILKQSKEVIIRSIFDKTKNYTSRINIIKEDDKGGRVSSMIRGNHPGFFLPNSRIIDKIISFTDDGAPNPEDRGLFNSGYGVFKLERDEDRIDSYTQIGQYDRGNLFIQDIKKAGGRELEKMIRTKKTLYTSEIMAKCGRGLYIIMSCSELNLYNDDTLIGEENVRLYRKIRAQLNKYHQHFSKLWDSYCNKLEIVESEPITMSVQNQLFSSIRGTSEPSAMGKRKRTKKKQNIKIKNYKKTNKK